MLKISGIVGSGGEAKMLIAAGAVLVNGHIETRKRRKIVDGDHIVFEDEHLIARCVASPSPEPANH
ncbi:MAG: RNA-binding S4 domain-containing protein [Pseudomonadota bacterium]